MRNPNSSAQSLYSFIRKTAVFTLLATATLPAIGCSREPRPRHVVLIVLDATRADRLSSYGYQQLTTPNMDALADRSAVFLNHFVQRTHTRATLPTIFLSRYFTCPLFPESGVVPLPDPADLFRTLDSEAISLPRALSDAGFFTAAISAHVWLKPGTRFAADFDELHELSSLIDYDRRYSYPRAEQVVDFAIQWVNSHRGQDFFLYLHFMDTHFPHLFDADAREFFGEEEYPADRFWPTGRPKDPNARLSDKDRRYLDALYDGSLRYVDREIGRLMQHLEAGASYADNLIAITSDHGEFLLERPGFFEHGHFWYDVMAHVPFILYYPVGLEAQRVSWFTEGVDVFPTILGMLRIPNPSGATFDGVDLQEMLQGAIDPKEYVIGGGALRNDRGAIRSKRYKAMFGLDNVLAGGGPLPAAEFSGLLFDVLADPLEQVNLWHRKPEVVDDLLRKYRSRALPSYRRYRAATTHEQPTSTFAISALHFGRNVKIPLRAEGLWGVEPSSIETASGWLESNEGPSAGLLARPSGSTIKVGFAIPNGVYLLSLGGAGDCTVGAGPASERHTLSSARFDPERPFEFSSQEIGEVSVADERFSATIEPVSSGSGCFVKFLAFEPLDSRPADSSASAEEVERLRALGYLD